ncbi:TPA: type II toxin-antitoxin system VapB family antitoxin [Pseudomonas aeruginosa]
MRTVSIFNNGRTKAIRIPRDMQFDESVTELEITREGDVLILRPAQRPSWESLLEVPAADADFLIDRPNVIDDSRFLSDVQ